MSTIYDTDVAPPQSYLAVEAIHALLAASSSIVTPGGIEAASDIYLHEFDTPISNRILVVREQLQLGGKFLSHDKREHTGVQVMAMINPRLENHQPDANARRWLYSIHKRVHDVVVGQTLTLDPDNNLPGDHAAILPVAVWQTNSPAAHDEDISRLFSTATYMVTLDAVR